MPPADAIPTFSAGGAPVSVLVDFDGTISLEDVTDHLLDEFGTDKDWRRRDAEYLRDEAGTRELIEWDVSILDADEATVRREAAGQRLDVGFARLVEVVREHGAAIEVVSDGLGFYVDDALERLGCADVKVATAALRFGEAVDRDAGGLEVVDRDVGGLEAVAPGGPERHGAGVRVLLGATFPYGHPDCLVCGTCKRERVRAHRAAGHLVIYVGDGQSDRYGAAHADVVFAKRRLAEVRLVDGAPFLPWDGLADVADWMESAFAGGRLPTCVADVDAWRASQGLVPPGFICGPEAWGPGRTTPGSPDRRAG